MGILVYRHITLDTNEVFYIGIGSIKRSKEKHNRSIFWKNVVSKHGYYIQIIAKDLSWSQACELEELLIAQYGRRDIKTGILVNQTNGGEGSSGTIVSKTTRVKLSLKNKGKVLTQEHKDKIGISNKGRIPNQEVRKKQIESASKKVIDLSTGIIYNSVKEVSIIFNLKYLPLNRRLNGKVKNDTTFKYY